MLPSVEDGQSSPSLPEAKILFVTWIAFGDFGDGGFHTHNFHNVDMRSAMSFRILSKHILFQV